MNTAPKTTMATAGSKRPLHDNTILIPSRSKPKLSRCVSMKGTVTVQEILDDVLEMNPKYEAAIAVFRSSLSCVAQECGSKNHNYTTTHGVEYLENQIASFFTYFCPRQMCTPKQAEIVRYASAMRAVVMHCIKEGHFDKKDPDVKHSLKAIAVARKCQGRKIISELSLLYVTKWWDSLQYKDKGIAHEYIRPSILAGDFDSKRSPEFPVKLEEVRDDGWLLNTNGFDPHNIDAPVFVRLPPEVAKLGMQGMEFSCMSLGYRNGAWQPFETYGCNSIAPLANVYPCVNHT
jgi:hypothetical protein